MSYETVNLSSDNVNMYKESVSRKHRLYFPFGPRSGATTYNIFKATMIRSSQE